MLPYLPPKDQDLNAWATNFDTLIGVNFAAYGLTAGQAASFHTLRQTFTNALATATNAATRTTSTVAAKNAAKAAMITNARVLAAVLQGNPILTNQQRNDLQITVRDRFPSPIGPPVTYPIVTPTGSTSGMVTIRFADQNTPAARTKPFGATALQLYAKVGTTPPASIDDCVFMGNFTKNSDGPGSRGIAVPFAPADVGKTAYLLGVWVNRRGEQGPASPLAQHTIAA
jgi:hypothetical protein